MNPFMMLLMNSMLQGVGTNSYWNNFNPQGNVSDYGNGFTFNNQPGFSNNLYGFPSQGFGSAFSNPFMANPYQQNPFQFGGFGGGFGFDPFTFFLLNLFNSPQQGQQQGQPQQQQPPGRQVAPTPAPEPPAPTGRPGRPLYPTSTPTLAENQPTFNPTLDQPRMINPVTRPDLTRLQGIGRNF